jgi:hypothetical protein
MPREKYLTWRILVFLFPFLYYFRALVPGFPFSLEIKNDFIVLYYKYKVYLLDMLSSGHFPLWSPAEASGYAFYSNPFTQTFYPLNLPLILVYKILGGYSLFDHQAFTILGVSIYALGLCLWLNLLLSSQRAVFFATIVITLSFKLGEILRFPNAVHTAAWMPWILYGITLAATQGKYLRSGLIIFVSCIMLLTGGYPYYAYFTLFLIPPYVLLLLFPGLRPLLITRKPLSSFSIGKFLLTLLLPSSAALSICAPYLLKVQQLMAQTVDRTGSSYEFSIHASFDPIGTLGSFIFPPAAQAEGWYYFSMTGVMLLMVYIASLIINRRTRASEFFFLLLASVWFIAISSITYARISPIFHFLWHYLPGFSSIRILGRMNIILLPILALLLARGYESFESLLTGMTEDGAEKNLRQRALILAISVLLVTTIIVAAVQVWLYQTNRFDRYWVLFFKPVHGIEWTYIYYTIISFIVMTSVMFSALKRPFKTPRSLLLVLLILLTLAVSDLFPVGSSQWMLKASTTAGSKRTTFGFHRMVTESLTVPRTRVYDTITFPRFNVGWLQSWYFERYLSFDQRVFLKNEDMLRSNGILIYGTPMRVVGVKDPGGPSGYAEFMGLKTGKRIFASQRIDHSTIKDFLSDVEITESGPLHKMEVTYYDGDKLTMIVQNSQAIYVSFIDNWDPDWKALANGKRVGIDKLFGTFKSVRIEPGENKIVFNYRPFFGH